jgi:DNA-binding transcriptional LysR family regulator
MSLDRLALFDLVLRSGSFAAAARREGLDPSSVSRAIAALEADLGTRLIARNTRRMRPTAAGEQLQADIAPHLVALERASARANAAQKAIRITASTTFARLCLVPVLAAFQRDNPDVTVDLRATDRPVDLVDERIDIAVRHGRLEDSALLARKLRNVDYWCVGRPDFDRVSTPEALGELPQLVFDLPGFRDGWTASQGRRQVRAGRRRTMRTACCRRRCRAWAWR